MNPLHEVEALRAIADGSGVAADWARSRLLFMEPEASVPFPEASVAFTPWLVARSDALDGLIEHLPDRRPLATVALLEALELGLIPEDTSALEQHVSEAIRGDGSPEDLHLATVLARLGPVDVSVVAAAASSTSVDRDWLLPSIALRGAERSQDLSRVAEDVAEALLAAERRRPGAIALCLAELGVPSRSSWDEPSASALDAATVLGLSPPDLPRARGSKKRHAQQAIRALLDGHHSAQSALVGSLAARDADLARRLVYSAAWLHLYRPADPVADAVYRHGGLDARRLAAARRAVTEDHLPVLRGALDHGLEKAAVLAHHLPGDPLAGDVIDFLLRHDFAHRIDLFLGVRAAWAVPDRIPTLLANEATLAVGLLLAEWLPTLEVLEALLAVTLPEGEDWTAAYARALAGMGDAAAAEVLRTLIQDEPEATAGARHLAESILHQPLA